MTLCSLRPTSARLAEPVDAPERFHLAPDPSPAAAHVVEWLDARLRGEAA